MESRLNHTTTFPRDSKPTPRRDKANTAGGTALVAINNVERTHTRVQTPTGNPVVESRESFQERSTSLSRRYQKQSALCVSTNSKNHARSTSSKPHTDSYLVSLKLYYRYKRYDCVRGLLLLLRLLFSMLRAYYSHLYNCTL